MGQETLKFKQDSSNQNTHQPNSFFQSVMYSLKYKNDWIYLEPDSN